MSLVLCSFCENIGRPCRAGAWGPGNGGRPCSILMYDANDPHLQMGDEWRGNPNISVKYWAARTASFQLGIDCTSLRSCILIKWLLNWGFDRVGERCITSRSKITAKAVVSCSVHQIHTPLVSLHALKMRDNVACFCFGVSDVILCLM